MTSIARGGAIVIALLGLLDPAIHRTVETPIAIETRSPAPGDPARTFAASQRDALAAAMGRGAVLDGANDAQAIVLFGGVQPPAYAGDPIIVVRPASDPSVGIARVSAPALSLPGQPVPVGVTLRGTGVAGRRTTVALEIEGVRLATGEHTWTSGDERRDVTLSILPGAPGLHHVRASAATEGLASSVADLGVPARDRRLRVLTYEPRPSWPLTFVRRALEDDARFAVASLTRSSRGITTTTGQPPSTLPALDGANYDAIVVGAPEDLTDRDLDVLDRFAAARGGQVLLLPDRPLTPRLVKRFRIPALAEVLLEKPVAVTAGPSTLQASELLVAADDAAGLEALGTAVHRGARRPAIFAVQHGDGRIIVSGLLDAWRYRVAEDAAFDLFWRSAVSEAALAAPEILEVSLEPGLARPGEAVQLIAVLRRTELRDDGGSIVVPAMEAAIVGSDGGRQMVRLWPAARPGRFEGSFVAPQAGEYVISVSGDAGQADTVLRVSDDVVHPANDTTAAADFAAASSGGAVVADAADAARALRELEQERVEEPVRIMRSGWWIVPFCALLCIEWAARRRRGLP